MHFSCRPNPDLSINDRKTVKRSDVGYTPGGYMINGTWLLLSESARPLVAEEALSLVTHLRMRM